MEPGKNDFGSYDPDRLATSRETWSALARALVEDASVPANRRADVWLAARRAPPNEAHRVGAWIGVVLRNLGRQDRRDDKRRQARERKGATPEATPSTAEVIAEEEARRKLVAAVLALEEPHKKLLLLRYWEGLDPVAIGRTLGHPTSTIRDRLARAEVKLRESLDRQHGDRATWRAMLLPLSATSAIPAVVTLSGVFFMSTKFIAAAAACVGVFVALWSTLRSDPLVTRGTPAGEVAVALDGPSIKASPSAAATNVETLAATREVAEDSSPAPDIATRPRLRVVDRKTGDALGGANVWFTHARAEPRTTIERDAYYAVAGIDFAGESIREGVLVIADAEGEVEIPPFGEYLGITARAPSRFGVSGAAEGHPLPTRIELDVVSDLTVVTRALDPSQQGSTAELPIAIGRFLSSYGWAFELDRRRTDGRGIALFEDVQYLLRHDSPESRIVVFPAFPCVDPLLVDLPRDPYPKTPLELSIPAYGFAEIVVTDANGSPLAAPMIAGFDVSPRHEQATLGGNELALWVDLDQGRVRIPVGVGTKVGVALFFVDDSRDPLRFDFMGPREANESVVHTITAGAIRPRLLGRVVDEADEPIAGRLLRASVDLPGRGWPEIGRDLMDGFSFRTKADGQFVIPVTNELIEKLPAELLFTTHWNYRGSNLGEEFRARVLIEKDGIGARGDTSLGTIVLKRDAMACRGVVVDADGLPVVGASIAILYEAADGKHFSERSIATTDAAGRFEVRRTIASGSAMLSVKCDGFLTGPSPEFAPGVEDLEIVLHRTASVRGRVLLPTGADPSRFVVGFRGGAVLQWNDVWPMEPKSAPLDSEGRFEFDRLDSGTLRVGVYVCAGPFSETHGPPLLEIDDLVAKRGLEVVDSRLGSIDLRASIREMEFTVTDGTGSPIAGARVEAVAEFLLQQRLETVTDGAGLARLVLGITPQRIAITRDGYRSHEVLVGADDGGRAVDVVLEAEDR